MRPLNMHRRKPLGFRRQRGAVAILLTVAMVALVAMAGLTLDGGHLMLNKSRLQNAVDAAALSGAKTLSQTYGVAGAATATRDAALNTLRLNADAEGNGELARAIAERGGVGNFANVEFSTSVYGPFAAGLPANARYVRVTVANHGLVGFFWRFLDSIGAGDLGEKRVAAVATAGPSPSAQESNLLPLLVCGDVTKRPISQGGSSNDFWGHAYGDRKTLKDTSWQGTGAGPGNYQLLDLVGNGANGVRKGLAEGVDKSYSYGDTVTTKPGNSCSIRDGLNTRFGDGSYEKAPSDLVVGPMEYEQYVRETAACLSGGAGCQPGGMAERRIVKVVVVDCDTDKKGGKKDMKVLGIGCFFAVQKMESKGCDEIVGQFVRDCSSGYSGSNPSQDVGPQIIQLYKTYMNGGVPSKDS